MALTSRVKQHILIIVTQVLPVLGTLIVLALGIPYRLKYAMLYSLNLWSFSPWFPRIWNGLVLTVGVCIVFWIQSLLAWKITPKIQHPDRLLNSMGEIIPRFQPPLTIIPMVGIILGYAWDFVLNAQSYDRLLQSILSGVKSLVRAPVPVGVCVFLGISGIIVCMRYAAINTEGRTRRMPRLIWRFSIAFFIAAICEFISRTWFKVPWIITEATLLAAIPVCILTFTRLKSFWFAKTETFLLVTVVSGACLASRSLLVGLVWTLALSITGYRIGDWIGWCRLTYRRRSYPMEILRWLMILALITWVTINPAAFDKIFVDHLFLILAVVLLIDASGPMRLLPAFRPWTDEKNSDTEIRRKLETTLIKNSRSGKGRAAIQKAPAKLKRNITGRSGLTFTEPDRTIFMELDAAQWTANREQWPGILEKESALLMAWLELEYPNIEINCTEFSPENINVDDQPGEAVLRFLVYRSKETFTNGMSREQVESLYQLLRSMGKKQPVITRWLLWRAFFAHFPDSTEEAVQREKLLVNLETSKPLDLLATVPPSLWMNYKSDAFQMLRIAEHAAWRAVVVAGRHASGSELARSVFKGCSETWTTTRRELMSAERNPIALISTIKVSSTFNPVMIEKTLKQAERRRPALRMAQYWTAYAEYLAQLAKVRLSQQVGLSAEKLKEKLRQRIAGGFLLPKPEVK